VNLTSLWDDTVLEADVVVIGAGIIGLSTALELLTCDPQLQVMVLERDVVPSGATSRNAGFACFGSLGEICADLDRMGSAAALDIIARRWHGLQLLRHRCGDATIEYTEHGGCELFLSDDPALSRIDEVNHLLSSVFQGAPVFERRDDLVETYRFGSAVRALVRTPFEGTIHSGKLVQTLLEHCTRAGAQLRTGCLVTEIDEWAHGVRLRVTTPIGQRTLSCGTVVMATNGFTSKLDVCTPIMPGRGQIIVTEPISDLPFAGSFHFDEGYWYFRSLGNRILFGGGRHLEVERETTTELDVTESIQQHLEHHLRTIVAPWAEMRISRRWSGIMGFTPDKLPRVERRGRIVTAFGCNGMGIAIGSGIAAQAARLCT